jgi:hypothetical protein
LLRQQHLFHFAHAFFIVVVRHCNITNQTWFINSFSLLLDDVAPG